MGGVELDLRHASLDPAGTELEIATTMGGIQVLVPSHWAVEIDTKTLIGGFDAHVTPPEELAEGAPTLHVRAVALMGGGLVTTKAG